MKSLIYRDSVVRSLLLIVAMSFIVFSFNNCGQGFESSQLEADGHVTLAYSGLNGLSQKAIVPYSHVDGYAVVDGDMIIGQSELIKDGDEVKLNLARSPQVSQKIYNHVSHKAQQGLKVTNKVYQSLSGGVLFRLWEGGQVPVVIDNQIAGGQLKNLEDSIKSFNELMADQQINVQFVERNQESAYVKFKYTQEDNCSSTVGYTGREAVILLGNGCYNQKTIHHEMMHALGFWHEHSRSDRDQHIIVNYNNLNPKHSTNYNVWPGAESNTVYDIESIMHYGSYDNSLNGEPVITTKSGQTFKSSDSLSQLDLEGLKSVYGTEQDTIDYNPMNIADEVILAEVRQGFTRFMIEDLLSDETEGFGDKDSVWDDFDNDPGVIEIVITDSINAAPAPAAVPAYSQPQSIAPPTTLGVTSAHTQYQDSRVASDEEGLRTNASNVETERFQRAESNVATNNTLNERENTSVLSNLATTFAPNNRNADGSISVDFSDGGDPGVVKASLTIIEKKANQISLSWTATNTSGNQQKKLYRNGVLLQQMSGHRGTHIDKSVQPGTSYEYRLSVYGNGGSASAVARGVTLTSDAEAEQETLANAEPATEKKLPPPTRVAFARDKNGEDFIFTYDAAYDERNSNKKDLVSKYNVFANGKYITSKNSRPDSKRTKSFLVSPKEFSDKGVSGLIEVHLTSQVGEDYSAPSNKVKLDITPVDEIEEEATPETAGANSSNTEITLRASAGAAGSVLLIWNNISKETKYNIYVNNQYKTTQHGFNGSEGSRAVTGLAEGTEYTFYVVAINENGQFLPKSNEVKLTTTSRAPASASTTAPTNANNSLSSSDVGKFFKGDGLWFKILNTSGSHCKVRSDQASTDLRLANAPGIFKIPGRNSGTVKLNYNNCTVASAANGSSNNNNSQTLGAIAGLSNLKASRYGTSGEISWSNPSGVSIKSVTIICNVGNDVRKQIKTNSEKSVYYGSFGSDGQVTCRLMVESKDGKKSKIQQIMMPAKGSGTQTNQTVTVID